MSQRKLFVTLARIAESIVRLTEGNKLVVYGIKFIPPACTFLLTIHVGLLLVGIYEPITVALGASLLVLLVILLSIRFHFCLLHKLMLLYMGLFTLCICLQKYEAFGVLLPYMRLFMFTMGVLLLSKAFIKCKGNECK